MISTDTKPPAWDLNSLYLGLNDPKLETDLENCTKAVESIRAELSETVGTKEFWNRTWPEFEKTHSDFTHIRLYLSALSSLDVKNTEVQAWNHRLSRTGQEITKVYYAFSFWCKNASVEDLNSLSQLPGCKSLERFIAGQKKFSQLMSNLEIENLLADLNESSSSLWQKNYQQLIAKISFEVEIDGQKKQLSLSQRRSYLEDSRPEVRKEVFHSSNKALAEQQFFFESSLNGIVGTRLSRQKFTGIKNPVESALFQHKITAETLESVFLACKKSRALLHSYLKWKEQQLSRPLGIYDLEAPVASASEKRLSWSEAWGKIQEAFAAYPRLLAYCEEMLTCGRIEATFNSSKAPGGYCATSYSTRKAYIYLNFNGSAGDLLTLAHELGHAFHSEVLKNERMAKTFYPSTLAETASTFAEALMARTLLSDPNLSPNEKKSLLVTELNRSLVFLLDIPFRYDFEVAFHNEKKTKHVSAQRASELMLAAQKFWLGDTIADSELDPCFWMSKMHFYMPSALFYNFPYTVGFLLSQHLTDSFVKDPKKFTPIYEQFLIETGDHTVEEVITNTFNRDAHKADFWLEALNRTEALFGELKRL